MEDKRGKREGIEVWFRHNAKERTYCPWTVRLKGLCVVMSGSRKVRDRERKSGWRQTASRWLVADSNERREWAIGKEKDKPEVMAVVGM